jgi:hypothetical protein
VFEPTGCLDGDYNLWKGFGVSRSSSGSWDKLKTHIKDNICRGNEEHYEYMINWMARGLQELDSAGEVAIVLKGEEGTGKGTLCHAYGKLFGQHYKHVSHAKHVTGNFNSILRDALLVFADEAFWAGDKQGESVLKTLITEERLTIEQKGKEASQERNRIKLIIASNYDWVVPAGTKSRRFCVFDVKSDQMQNRDYFKAINEELELGGYSKMLDELLNIDLRNFDVSKAPKTDALIEQRIHSLQTSDSWWMGRLQIGTLSDGSLEWSGTIMCNDLYNDYVRHCQEVGMNRKLNKHQLTYRLKKLLDEKGPNSRSVRYRDEFNELAIGREFEFPNLQVCRIAFEKHIGQMINWDESCTLDPKDIKDKVVSIQSDKNKPF